MPHTVIIDGERYETRIVERHRDHVIVSINGARRKVELFSEEGDEVFSAEIDGEAVDFARASGFEQVFLRGHGATLTAAVEDPIAAAQDSGAAADEIRAPMPGSVIEIVKGPGEAVKRGDTVLTIESMKLQTNLAAPRDGVVAELLVGPGDTFGKDAAVARLEPVEEEIR
ncbi:MAG: acetyl-CoA carboxylase biotin carboxyl carrier protein subunit [Minwuia sp.]|uniref:acetyl-CoA carboxylase biotin carboxyl carrier protein subunit n=1 Tax=Minwuia sp. TaxID=2493630 RepID=UPI003A8494F2